MQGYPLGDKDAIKEADSWIRSVIRNEKWFDRLRQDQEDLFQEVRRRFLVALRGDEIKKDGKLRAYLCRMTEYTCIDHLRKQREIPKPPDVITAIVDGFMQDLPDPLDEAIINQLKKRLKEAIAVLPREDQDLLRMHFYDEMPYGEIAERLGIAEGAAKTRKFRIIGKLRRAFFEALGECNHGNAQSTE